jgi:hypothetical protein
MVLMQNKVKIRYWFSKQQIFLIRVQYKPSNADMQDCCRIRYKCCVRCSKELKELAANSCQVEPNCHVEDFYI